MSEKYNCKICSKQLDKKRFLRRHLVIRHQVAIFRNDGTQVLYKKCIKRAKYEKDQNIFKCDKCEATFKSKDRLYDHRPRHNEENYILCEVEGCGHRMFKRDRFHHMRQIHTFKTQLCEICSRTFRNYECLRRHRYKVHDSIKCKGCGSCYLKKEQANHVCPKTLEPRPEFVRNHHCETCGRSYTSAFLLKRHQKDKHNLVEVKESLLNCINCMKDFKSRELLNRHKKICQNLLCTVCSCPFTTAEKLDHHMTRHAEEKSQRNFKCPQCTCRFNTEKILQTHILKRHSTEEQGVGMNYECHICDQMYRKSILLKIHLETRHSLMIDDLDNVCVICCEEFGENLPKHMKSIHKKNFICNHEGCTKKYRTEESLLYHTKTHRPDYVPDLSCSVCHNIYPNQKSLVEHFKKHGYSSNVKPRKTQGRKKDLRSDSDTD